MEIKEQIEELKKTIEKFKKDEYGYTFKSDRDSYYLMVHDLIDEIMKKMQLLESQNEGVKEYKMLELCLDKIRCLNGYVRSPK